MKQLLAYYERELGTLRELNSEFAEQYPSLAGQLGMPGGICGDPHIERLIQATAMLNARTAKRLDDSYPEFTEAMLHLNAPHCLQPFPCTAIACASLPVAKAAKMSGLATIPRGTVLNSVEVEGVVCKFVTAYDVAVGPLTISRAVFSPVIDALPSMAPPEGVTSSIRLVIESPSASFSLAQAGQAPLRVFIEGEQAFCTTLRDALFMRAHHAYSKLTARGAGRRFPLCRSGPPALRTRKRCCRCGRIPIPRFGCSPSTSRCPKSSISSISTWRRSRRTCQWGAGVWLCISR